MDDAWQDIAPPNESNSISIPIEKSDTMNVDDGNWNGGPRTPERRRSSRSRSPRRDDRGRNNTDDPNPGNNLHVSGLSRKVDTRDLEDAFGKAGRVLKASVMYDPHTRESRGFGFVTMESNEEAEAAVTALNGVELMGKQIKVEKARRGRARTPTPGKYHGPTKKRGDPSGDYRPYNPRPHDSRYRDFDDRRRDRDDYRDRGDRDYRRRDDYRGDRDRGGGGGDYERRRDYDRRY